MPRFRVGDDDEQEFLDGVCQEFEPDLVKAGVTIKLMFAIADVDANGVTLGPPLKLHGMPCVAITKINSAKLRAEGMTDATVTVDAGEWADGSDETRTAMLHHELHHFIVKLDRNEKPSLDKVGRPVLKSRRHDFQVGWFHDIAQIHGDASYEVRQASLLINGDGQMLFPWATASVAQRGLIGV